MVSTDATDPREDAPVPPCRNRKRLAAACITIALILAVVLRLVALRSDSFTRLDWSAGQLTDEAFYTHNARNVALFGHPRTDEFNNMLLSPVLHFLQVAVFKAFGTGLVQARSISVACSLLTLLLVWLGARRIFDNRIALTAALILGLDHTNLLYNRMALMDTPAAFLATAAFLAFALGITARDEGRRRAWLALSGVCLGLTFISRSLCMYLLLAPFVALWLEPNRGRRRWADMAAVAIPLGLVFAVTNALWYAPNREVIAAMTRYYRTNQVQPHSFRHLMANVQHAVIGDFRGMAPYLFRHTPVVFALTLLALLYPRVLVRTTAKPERAAGAVFLYAWLACGWAMLAVVSYSPSRYYVSTYPAMAVLAAVAFWNMPRLFEALARRDAGARLLRGGLTWFLAFHLVEAMVHHGGVLPKLATEAALYAAPLIPAVLAVRWTPAETGPVNSPARGPLVAAAALGWLVMNGVWLGYWATHIRYTQYDMSRWLGANLPANSVLLGDIGVALSHENRFEAVHVQDGLCNYVRPVERYAGRPRFIVILDGRWKEEYWRRRYPQLVDRAHLLRHSYVMRWPIGVYDVDGALSRRAASQTPTSSL